MIIRIICALSILSFCIRLTSSEAQLKLNCPLNEGRGKIINCFPEDFKGLITGDEKALPLWKDRELTFSGTAGYGVIKIIGGGKILSGPVFKISLEVKPTAKNTSGYFITCKAQSTKDGGFYISYWAAGKQLTFGFADGKNKYSFTAELKNPLSLNKWHPVEVEYDGTTLKILLDDNVILSEKKSGLLLAKSLSPLFIGNYTRKIKGMFTGSVRNVKLSVPVISNKIEGVTTVSYGMPQIDGKLNDSVWRKAKFYDNFHINGNSKKRAANPTSFAVAADRKNIYMAIRCAIAPDRALKFKKRNKDDEKIWNDDTIEVFILPWGTDNCIQLAVNPGGSQSDALLQYNLTQRKFEFDPKWQTATSINGKEWITEIALPYEQLLALPNGGNIWKFNICRTDQSQKTPLLKYSSYGKLPSGAEFSGFADDKLFSILAGIPTPDYSAEQKSRVVKAIQKLGVDKICSESPLAMIAAAPFMYIGTNLVAPNVVLTKSGSGTIIMRERAHTRFRFDLPEGISLIYAGINRRAEYGLYDITKLPAPVMHQGKHYTRYELKPVYVHHASNAIPLFLKSSLKAGSETKMYFSAAWAGSSQKWESIPLKSVDFPTPGIPTGIIACYAWIPPAYIKTWPDCINTLAQLGFNMLPLNQWHPGVSDEEMKSMAAKARKAGMKILSVHSPFYDVRFNLDGNSTGTNGKPIPNIKDACPAYRGKLYHDNMKGIEKFVRLVQPDYVQFDIEQYILGAHNALTGVCQRCTQIIKAHPDQKAEDVVSDMGTRMALDLYNSVKHGMRPGSTIPDCGMYHTSPGGFTYQSVFNLDKMLKVNAMQLAHPVYYNYSGFEAGRKTREYRKILGNNRIFPWVTNGWNNYTSPKTNYDMILNVYGSGALGMYWYGLERIEAADFYFYAKAMEVIKPVSDMLAQSEPFKLKYSAPAGIEVTGLRQGNNGIILVAASRKTVPKGNISVELPEYFSGHIWSLPAEKPIAAINSGKAEFKFVPAITGTRTALYYIGKKAPAKR